MTAKFSVAPKDVFKTIESLFCSEMVLISYRYGKITGQPHHDSASGADWLDFYTFFASRPLGCTTPARNSRNSKKRYSVLR